MAHTDNSNKIEIPHLETDVTTHCNLSCVACNHMVPLWRHSTQGPIKTTPEIVYRDLSALSKVLHVKAFGLLGGEPLLHPQVSDIVKVAKQSGIANEIELWSNGSILKKVINKPYNKDLWLHLDTFVLSVYEGVLDETDIEYIRDVCSANNTALVVKDERHLFNFRTNLEQTPTNREATLAKFRGCFFRAFSRVVNDGFFYTCCCAPHMPVLLQNKSRGTDGIDILRPDLNTSHILEYLERSEPLGCCSICAGRDTAVPIKWQQEKNPTTWISKSKGIGA